LKKPLLLTGVLYSLVFVFIRTAPAAEKLLGDEADGSRAVPVHLVPLLDEQGDKINPDQEPVLPFSMRKTCGACHDYNEIGKGWHFNAADVNVHLGRPAQPWILADAATVTQVPLSYRPWPGAFNPQQLGITTWQFVQLFGRQMPGGGVGEIESTNPDEAVRSSISGKLEINCLSCHDVNPAHDRAEYAAQISRQNFRWAATAACGFASVRGSAKNMPDTYDPLMPELFDDPKLVPPTVEYHKSVFDTQKRVFFDIVRRIPKQRCYFCHSSADVGANGIMEWAVDEDVHLAAGLLCVDCHRHGLDHNITRGYDGEAAVSTNSLASASTCAGCHEKGRLGAPVPEHRGIPAVHFDRLTCTACHSGPLPQKNTIRTKTSRAHALGTHNVNKSDDVLPHVIYPVFSLGAGGKIGPHKLIWPAFWGGEKDEKIMPVPIELVRQGAQMVTQKSPPASGDWPQLDEKTIIQALSLAASSGSPVGQPFYVCGGLMHRLDEKGNLTAAKHKAAEPYLWPIAHDVRPAAQSLGAGGCGDCHTTDSAFFFGGVEIDSPVVSGKGSFRQMTEFEGLDPVYTKAFAFSFVFRPWLKVFSLGSAAVLAGVLLLYALKALCCIVKVLSEKI
jgi:hypothetical protein